VSICITQGGEAIVIRVLNRDKSRGGLEKVGPLGDTLVQLRKLLNQPNGVYPLYRSVRQRQEHHSGSTVLVEEIRGSPQRKTMTIEDPGVWCSLSRTSRPAPSIHGWALTYPSALRSFMRQDPDIVYIDECRDLPTLELALEFSLTGHLVLTALNANDFRFGDYSSDGHRRRPYLIASTVTGVVSQRLCRKICPHCTETYTVDASDAGNGSVGSRQIRARRLLCPVARDVTNARGEDSRAALAYSS